MREFNLDTKQGVIDAYNTIRPAYWNFSRSFGKIVFVLALLGLITGDYKMAGFFFVGSVALLNPNWLFDTKTFEKYSNTSEDDPEYGKIEKRAQRKLAMAMSWWVGTPNFFKKSST